MAQFLLAVRLDPSNDNAQRNLELMLRQPRRRLTRASRTQAAATARAERGPGAQDPGHGY